MGGGGAARHGDGQRPDGQRPGGRRGMALLRQVAALGSGSRRAPGGLAQEVAESRACARGQPRHSLALPALELQPWFTKPVRPGFGLGRYQTGPNSKFKFEFKKMKNSQKIPKNTLRCDEPNGVKFSQKFVHLV